MKAALAPATASGKGVAMGFPASSHMALALALAREAAAAGEVPVGALVTGPDGRILGQGRNETRAAQDPTAHAEMLAIRRAAAASGNERLVGCTLWVTLEPCAMCAAAIAEARIARLVFAADDPKGGGVEHGARVFRHSHHAPDVVGGVGEAEAAALLRDFFAARRRAADHTG